MWVDAAEDAYAKIAMTDEFRQIYGDLVNAQSRMRELQQRQMAAMGAQWGLPTREEVDSIGKRLQEVRRELRAARDEVTALRDALAEVREQGVGGASATAQKPAAKKAAGTRRSASARKSAASKAPGKKAATKTAATKKAARKSAPAKTSSARRIAKR